MSKISKEDRLFLLELGKRIKSIRKEKGITQVELGHRCDLEKPNMNKLEKGTANPTALTLKKICVGLETTLQELFEGLEEI